MIEIVYNKEKESAVGNEEYFCIPRNIRQIGLVPSQNRIYIEDYAYDYLNTVGKEKTGNAAILLGKCNWKEGVSYIFAKSALFMEKLEASAEHISVTDEIWGAVYEEMKQYFPGQEVVGWYLALPGNSLRITDTILRTHLNHFGGNDKVLFLTDPEEQEEAFFLYRNGQLERQDGYYIYYEKNTPMQEYMLKKRPQNSVDGTGDVQDRAVKDFRKIIARKKEEKETRRNTQLLYAAGMGVAAITLALGVTAVSRKMKLEMPGSQAGDTVTEGASGSVDASLSDLLAGAGKEMQKEYGESKTAGDSSEGELNGEKEGIGAEQADPEEREDYNGTGQAVSETADGKTTDDAQTAGAGNLGNGESDSDGTDETTLTENVSGRADDENAGNNSNGKKESGTGSDLEKETSAGTYGTARYTIRAGDTLSRISVEYYGDTGKVKEICKLNDLKEDDIIYPGQTILLP